MFKLYIRNFKIYRRRNEFTHREIGELCKCSKQNVFVWEEDNIIPDKYGELLSQLLHVSEEDKYIFNNTFFEKLLSQLDLSLEELSKKIQVSSNTLLNWSVPGNLIRLKKFQIITIISILDEYKLSLNAANVLPGLCARGLPVFQETNT